MSAAPARRVAIVQSSYIPWKGYFDLIDHCDEFVLYDNVQYTRRDWRNRNRIKTARGVRWLTIPVRSKGRYLQRIDETEIEDPGWARSHWAQVAQSYAEAEHFDDHRERIEELYAVAAKETMLARVNELFIRALCELLGIETRVSRLPDSALAGAGPTERLVSACRALGASEYVSGPAARSYLDVERFDQAGVSVSWMDYSGYPEYPQPFPPFEHGVSVLDLLFCTGPLGFAAIRASSAVVTVPHHRVETP